jgi:hypothetical protein
MNYEKIIWKVNYLHKNNEKEMKMVLKRGVSKGGSVFAR